MNEYKKAYPRSPYGRDWAEYKCIRSRIMEVWHRHYRAVSGADGCAEWVRRTGW